MLYWLLSLDLIKYNGICKYKKAARRSELLKQPKTK